METLLESMPIVFELIHAEDSKLHRQVVPKHIMNIEKTKNMQLGLELN